MNKFNVWYLILPISKVSTKDLINNSCSKQDTCGWLLLTKLLKALDVKAVSRGGHLVHVNVEYLLLLLVNVYFAHVALLHKVVVGQEVGSLHKFLNERLDIVENKVVFMRDRLFYFEQARERRLYRLGLKTNANTVLLFRINSFQFDSFVLTLVTWRLYKKYNRL